VGFWGSYVVCRTDQPLDTVDAIVQRDDGLEWSERRADGW
jgi:hypothetical protein